MSTKELIINERILARVVRLVGSDGEQLGIKPIEEARKLADEAGYDLVLVSPGTDPPVCKIMDYGKFKYEQKKQQHEHHKRQPTIKELRLRPKTEEHDMLIRVRQARQFLERGDRVLVNMMFRGRELSHVELGQQLLQRFSKELEDICKVDKPPVLEGKRISMVLVKK